MAIDSTLIILYNCVYTRERNWHRFVRGTRRKERDGERERERQKGKKQREGKRREVKRNGYKDGRAGSRRLVNAGH